MLQPDPIPNIASRYAPRVYARSMAYDAADREVTATTGAAELVASNGTTKLVPELLNSDGESVCTTEYSARGAVKEASSSYGSLVSSITRTADNLVTDIVYGDAASTTTSYLYDERRRISSVQTYRGPPASGAWDATNPNSSTTDPDAPTRQMVLQDEDFLYDVVGNPVEIRDWRDPQDWPDGAKPVTKKIEYDDLYRATRIKYEYAAGDDEWQSPFEADIDGSAANDDERRAKPSPHVEFQRRMLEQTFEYDWVGNNRKTGDDESGFYDRSLGTIDDNDEAGKPYQLKGAALAGGNGGSLQARYDAAGYMTKMQLARSGPCIGGGAGDCSQQFRYEWDEVGRLARARRWDNNVTHVDTFDPGAAGTPAADLRYTYDASDQRVLKEAVDLSSQTTHSYTAYIFETLELRRAQFGEHGETPSTFDYEINHYTVVPYLLANGVRLSRVVYHITGDVPEEAYNGAGAPGDVDGPTSSSGKLHVFFELGDHLGSTSVVLDKATGELVERATFQAYGGAESDYRPDRWKSFREDYRFTGKEEDVEVGLQYFGKRYLNPLLGRWISADPLAVHAPGEADLNVYAYVHGQILKNIDPLGLADGPVSEEKQAPANGSAHEGPVDTTSKSYLDSFTDWSYDVDSGNFTLSYEGGEKVTVSADEIVGKSSTGKEHYEDLNKGAHYRDGVVAPGEVTSETAPELYAVKEQVEKTLAWMRTDAGLDAMMKYFPALVGMNASGLSIGALVGGSMKGSSLAIKPTRTQVRSSVAEIAPQQIRFSQRSVNGAGELTKSMKQHGWKGDPIDVVKMGDGKLTTLDNTRVLAASRAGVKVKANVHKADDPLPESLVERFSTKNGSPKTWGEAVNLRIQKQGAAYQKQNPNGSSATGTTD